MTRTIYVKRPELWENLVAVGRKSNTSMSELVETAIADFLKSNIMVKLLVMFCPYCGSRDIHETNRVEGHTVESVSACCLSCNEEFSIDRNLEENKDAEEGEK